MMGSLFQTHTELAGPAMLLMNEYFREQDRQKWEGEEGRRTRPILGAYEGRKQSFRGHSNSLIFTPSINIFM